jgi:hypothetical protein
MSAASAAFALSQETRFSQVLGNAFGQYCEPLRMPNAMRQAAVLLIASVGFLAHLCSADECQPQYPQAFIMGTSLSHCQVTGYREKLRKLALGSWVHVEQLPEIHRYPPGVTYDGWVATSTYTAECCCCSNCTSS